MRTRLHSAWTCLCLALALVPAAAAQQTDPPLAAVPPEEAAESSDYGSGSLSVPDVLDAPAPASASAANEFVVGDVLARLRSRLEPGACMKDGDAQVWRRRYAHNPRVFGQHVLTILPLLEFVLSEAERRDLPGEFALIPIVESWYRPAAIGAGGPAGMWQMIASTARNHGVTIRVGYDGRLSPIESTHAALGYLDTLHRRFGDWQATVMAYNAGEFRLLSALRRSGVREVAADRGLPRGLSPITYHYVHKLQALSCLLGEADAQGLQLPAQHRMARLQAVEVEAGISSLHLVAAAVGADAGQVRELNPGFRQGRIADGAPRLVLAPIAEAIVAAAPADAPALAATVRAEAAAQTAATDAGPTRTHRVGHGDTLWSIARHYGISIDVLRQLNRLDLGKALRVGQKLLLPR